MKILFVAPIAVPHINLETYFLNALQNENVDVLRFGYNEMATSSVGVEVVVHSNWIRTLKRYVKSKAPFVYQYQQRRKAEALFKVIEQCQPSAIWAFSKAIPRDVIQKIRRNHPSICMVGFAVDDPQDIDRSSTQSTAYNLFFSNDTASVNTHRTLGANCHWLPFAADIDMTSPLTVSDEDRKRYGSDVVFIGSVYQERERLLQLLTDYDLAIWGPDSAFPHENRELKRLYRGVATDLEVRKIYSASKILINPQFGYGENTERGNWVNLRLFEAGYCGVFQLTDYKKDIGKLFNREEDIVTFQSDSDLRNKIEHYLQHEEERIAIARQLQQQIKSQHLYTHRIRTVLDTIKQCSCNS